MTRRCPAYAAIARIATILICERKPAASVEINLVSAGTERQLREAGLPGHEVAILLADADIRRSSDSPAARNITYEIKRRNGKLPYTTFPVINAVPDVVTQISTRPLFAKSRVSILNDAAAW